MERNCDRRHGRSEESHSKRSGNAHLTDHIHLNPPALAFPSGGQRQGDQNTDVQR